MANSPSASLIDTWLHPLPVSEFRARHWDRMPYAFPASRERLDATLAALPGPDLPALVQHGLEPIQAWFLEDGAINSLQIDRSQALQAYRAGLTIYGHLQPAVADGFKDALGQTLGCHRPSTSISFFASRRGAVTPPHVDGNHNFTLQLQGRKTWLLSPGLPWPGVAEQIADDPLLHDVFRTSRWAPDDQKPDQEILEPGSLLYCPPGAWHSVTAEEDALAFNVSISTRDTWADVLLPALRGALLERPAWRQPVEGLYSSGEPRQRARQIISELLGSLEPLSIQLDVDDFFAAWDEPSEESSEGIPEAFVRNPLVHCQIIAAEADESFSVRVRSLVKQDIEHRLTVGWEGLQSFLTLIGTRGVQRAEDFDDVSELVIELVSIGVLRPHRGD